MTWNFELQVSRWPVKGLICARSLSTVPCPQGHCSELNWIWGFVHLMMSTVLSRDSDWQRCGEMRDHLFKSSM